MSAVRTSRIACDNMNHRRSDAPVPYCPQCGAVVNADVPRRTCSTEEHAVARRRGSDFCVGCGVQLIVRRT
jgi:hypothetical protein